MGADNYHWRLSGRGEEEEAARLRAENERLRKALQHAAIAFEDIAASEATDGHRNSYPAQVARGARREVSSALASEEQPK